MFGLNSHSEANGKFYKIIVVTVINMGMMSE